jgi:transcriptional regulator
MKLVSDAAGDAVTGRSIEQELLVGVTSDGEVRVRRQARAGSGGTGGRSDAGAR